MASISITAPSSAEEGEGVSASVRVTNTLDYHASFKATISAVPDFYPDYVIGSIDQIILSGDSVTRNVSFTMPNCKVTVFVSVERWSVDHWVYDSSDSEVVSLEVPATYHLSVHVPPWAAGGFIDPGSGDYPADSTVKLTAHPLSGYQFTSWGGDASGTSTTYNLYMDSDKYVEAYFEEVPVEPEPVEGTIIRKELEYSGSGDGIVPVANVPQGVSAKLHVWGRNDMTISQGMGIYWFVADPEGFVAEEYTDWGGAIGAGQDHEFISSGQFDLNKVGKYTVWIELLMGSQDNPEIVDRYIGDLCTVSAPDYKGSIARKELEYDETRGAIPVY
ncbi:MAG: hypothetical protein E3J60_00580 [Dehalococcoidia bacterium]|nr:MAG: hypothetical protein E3J60_00580 [Dehalococcoidia bacterium]